MPIMISILVFGVLFFSGVIIAIASTRNIIIQRMQHIGELQQESVELPQMAKSVNERVIIPLVRKLLDGVGQLAPAAMLERTNARLAQAGYPWKLQAKTLLPLQVIAVLIGLFLGLIACRYLSVSPAAKVALVGGGLAGGGLVPGWLVDRRAAARKIAIKKALPNIIDLLVVSVEAGLGLDGAMNEILQREEGPLMEEFSQALAEIRLGKGRQNAWRSIADRTQVRDLSAFMAALCQAEQLGSSISTVLRTHSETLRIKRSLRVRELAGKIPIKMLFPLIFFIFPAMFVIILGPGAISIMHNFGGIGF